MLTKRQKEILGYITKFIKKNDYAPSLEEIKEHFKLSSVSTIHQHIEAIREKGFLNKIENQPRSIELNDKKKELGLIAIPLLGTIAAGQPIETIEDPETIEVPKNQLSKSEKHYALKVQGNSMIDEGIFDGDTVIIKKQPTAENGETVVALLNDNEVTLKKIYKERDGFRLQPANPKIKPIFTKKLIIQGKVISVIRNYETEEKKRNVLYQKTKNLANIYNKLTKKGEILEKPEYKNLVNFSTNLDKPIHRWINMKEGYSRDLIINLIERFGISNDDFIFDPFCGSGTTLLVAKEKGINSLGFEINPFLAFLTKVKLNNYTRKDIKKIRLEVKKIKRVNFNSSTDIPKLSISKKLFSSRLKTILSIKKYISQFPEGKIKDLLNLCLLSILENCSISKKDGNGLKYPKNKIPEKVKPAFIEKLNQIIEDLEETKNWSNKSFIFEEDVRKLENILNNKTKNKKTDILRKYDINNLKKLKRKISLVMFSPPYMNCFDYTEVYKTELWFGDFIKSYKELKSLRNSTLSSHLNQTIRQRNELINEYVTNFAKIVSEKKLWNKKIPLMIKGYFEDMWLVLRAIHELVSPNGHCVIVVGNSAYGNIVIPTDLILGDMGLNVGFKSFKIEVARHLRTSSQQYRKINAKNMLRESLVILKK